MLRISRIIAPGYPHHIIQRGNNRTAVFFDDEVRQTYLMLLTGYARKHDLNCKLGRSGRIWQNRFFYCVLGNN